VDAVVNGTVEDLTTGDVLASLEAIGIQSLEEVAARLLEKIKLEAQPDAGTPTPIDLQMLRRPPPDGLEATIEHAVPQVPFLCNGTEHDPEDIRRFNGKAIAYLPTRTGTGDTQLHILDDMQLVRSRLVARYVNRLMASFAAGSLRSPRSASLTADFRGDALAIAESPASVTVGEHELSFVVGPEDPFPTPWVGRTLILDPGWWYSDLTQGSGFWNDRISFIGSSRSSCIFWEHINGQGDALLAGAHIGGDWIPFLTSIGWNDRISSFANDG
jgi:hypothetical protein